MDVSVQRKVFSIQYSVFSPRRRSGFTLHARHAPTLFTLHASRCRSGDRGSPTGKHGSALGSVTALPDGKKLNASGAASDNQITASTDLAFQVAVMDSGAFQEFNVGVTLTIQKSPKPIVLRKKVDVINAGETKNVTFTNIDLNGLFGLPTTVKVDIAPVPGEKTVSNNSAEYKVIFSVA